MIKLTHKDACELISIIVAMRQAHVELEQATDVKYMSDILDELVCNMDVTDEGTEINVENQTRFAFWLCADKYGQFAAETDSPKDLLIAQSLMTKLGGPGSKEVK